MKKAGWQYMLVWFIFVSLFILCYRILDLAIIIRLFYSQSLGLIQDLIRITKQSLIIFKNNNQMERKSWSQQEDLVLKQLVEQIGFTNWTLVALRLSQACKGTERAGKQCRERWINHLNSQVRKKPWTKSQDNIIFQMQNMHGNKWKSISRHLSDRTQNDIKNHFYATLRKGIRRLNKLLRFHKTPELLTKIKPLVISQVFQRQFQQQILQNCTQSIQNVFDFILKISRKQPTLQQSEQLLQSTQIVVYGTKLLDLMIKINEQYKQQKSTKKQIKQTKQKQKQKQRQKQQHKSQQLDIQFDISEYLCLEQLDQYHPKSQGNLHAVQSGQMSMEGSSCSCDSLQCKGESGVQEAQGARRGQ